MKIHCKIKHSLLLGLCLCLLVCSFSTQAAAKEEKQISDREYAKEALDSWYEAMKKGEYSYCEYPYWTLFMADATGASFEHTSQYHPDNDRYRQASDYAKTILYLCMLGENPYDFGEEHRNYVAELQALEKDGLYGVFANNVWTLMAYRACGETLDDKLLSYVKTKDLYSTFSVDLKGWALIALAGLLEEEEMQNALEALKKDVRKDGTFGNANSSGCVISGLVAVGAELSEYQITEKTLLECVVNQQQELFNAPPNIQNKDMIIALGDVIQGSNVWQRCYLTQEKWNKLLWTAKELSDDLQSEERENLQALITELESVNTYEGNGKLYYQLFSYIKQIDAASLPERKHEGITFWRKPAEQPSKPPIVSSSKQPVSGNKVKAKKIRLDQPKLTLELFQEAKITYKIEPKETTNKKVRMHSSNAKMIKILPKDRIQAVGLGEAKVSVCSVDGSKKTAVCRIRVVKKKTVTPAVTQNSKQPQPSVYPGAGGTVAPSAYPSAGGTAAPSDQPDTKATVSPSASSSAVPMERLAEPNDDDTFERYDFNDTEWEDTESDGWSFVGEDYIPQIYENTEEYFEEEETDKDSFVAEDPMKEKVPGGTTTGLLFGGLLSFLADIYKRRFGRF